MPGLNLTRNEAIERASIIKRVHSYRIELDLPKDKDVFSSKVEIRFDAQEGASTFIDAITSSVKSINLNGEELSTDLADGERIQLPNLAAENTLVIDAEMFYTNTGEGLHRFVDPADGEVYLYSQFEVPDSRRVFPVFEQPDLKAEFEFIVRVPSHWVVVSNQPEVKVEEKECGCGRAKTWFFKPTPRMSSYITAIVAGPYEKVTSELTNSEGRVIPLGVYARKSLMPFVDAEDMFELTRQGFEFYEEQFKTPYPFAMENAGCVTYLETYVFRSKVAEALRERRAITVLHELAHMWFGDLVTMKWWNDLWLNESFAEFMSTLAAAENTRYAKEAWATFAASEKTWAYRQDQLSSTHPIVAEIRDLADVQVNFDGITYAKGASVLRQMVAWVGQENFMAALKVYFDKHSWGNTVLDDLLVELERTSGRDVRAWSAKWLETAGVNTLAVEVENDEAGNISNLGIRQSYAEGFETLRPHRAVIGFYNLVDGKLTRTDRIELDIDGELTVVEEALGKKRPDLLLLNDEDLAYAKIRLDERSIETAIKHLGDIDSSVARGVVWGSLWDTVRDAQMPARKYVDLVLNNIGKETNSTALRTQINNLSATLHSFVAPEAREETRHRAADRLWELACVAEPDSDAQLQLLQAFINQTRTEEQYDNVQRLFEGELTLEGLDIDADLRWNLVCRLATGGRFSAEQIAAELENDNTANGQQYAAQAYASIPTAEAKAEYWNKIMVTGELSNMIQRYAISGFKSGKPELIAQYNEPYFEQIEGIWRSRSHEISMQIIGGMYPSEPTAELLERTEKYLASLPEDAAALYRQIAEARDGVARALKVQAADI